ncbi:keratin, type I cytoskeletal 9 [Folsomia candida]|uniref:keratin, type I cytoskeletal 9 n=1 Tax=Folsomia candida TaxID=158441 RepID=UPI000B8EEDC7|nr:keratin, type I cytoskeletal 9 [Folsomia candida]
MFDILNEDFTTYEAYEPFLKKSVSKGKEVPGGSVLQVQHVVNISVAKQDGPVQQYDPDRQILKVTLTDGESTVYALVAEQVPKLGINTLPGTKIKIVNTVPTFGQIIMLTRANSLILGGNVPKLVEKWNFQRAMDVKKEWGAVGKGEGNDGPPLWRPCGQKSVSVDVTMLRKMKAMDIVNEKKEVAGAKEGNQTQFDQQRQETISELMDKSARQKWQKPNKHLVTKEAQDIMDEGFTQEEATNALDKFKNPQKALRYLKANRGEYPPARTAPPEERRDKRRKGKGGGDDEDDDAPIPKEFQRPTSNISLFGFIAGTMNIQGGGDAAAAAAEPVDDYDNNYGRGRGRGRGRGGRGRGGDDYRSSRGDRRGGGSSDYRGGRGGRSDSQRPAFSSYDNSPALGATSSSSDTYSNRQSYESSSAPRGGGYPSGSSSSSNSTSRGGGTSRGGNSARGGGYSSSDRGGGGRSGSSYNNTRGDYSGQDRYSSDSQQFSSSSSSSYRGGEQQRQQMPSQDARNYPSAPPRFQKNDFPPASTDYNSSSYSESSSDRHQSSSRGRGGGGGGQWGSTSHNEYRNSSSSSNDWNPSSSIGPMVFTRGGGRGRGGQSSRGYY